MRRIVGIIVVAVSFVSSAAYADGDGNKYHVTPREKAACIVDASRLCTWTYPDEDKLIGCMKDNIGQLNKTCRVAFEAGLHRRGL